MTNPGLSKDIAIDPRVAAVLPQHRQLYYGGQWMAPNGGYVNTIDPATGASLGPCAHADRTDVEAAVLTAHRAFQHWRSVPPLDRGAMLRTIAQVLRDNADELALIDSVNCGNPVKALSGDALAAAAQIEYFAGLVTEVKGHTFPMGDGIVNMSVREPYGVCARIVAYNHPLMFTAGKFAPALAAGNTVVMKPPHQAPLSSYRMMELIEGILPPGVLNIVSGGLEAGEALVNHPLVPHVALIGSVPTGRAIARAAADRLKKVSLELGGKNACIVFPDADLASAAKGAVDGMNFAWCGQSCGSTSRLFLHESIYEQLLDDVIGHVRQYLPGRPTDPGTTMGSLVSQTQLDKVMNYIDVAKSEGATLVYGGNRVNHGAFANGFFVEPTVFGDVTPEMRIAREEVFGPVLAVLKWQDEDDLIEQVNSVDYGLTCSIWTSNLTRAHRTAGRVEAGYVWVNNSSRHFIGAPFGGYKQSGVGREECLDELLDYTQVKNINISLSNLEK